MVEQPQPVDFFFGRLIDERPATLEYGFETGIGATVVPRFPWQVGVHFGGDGSAGGVRLSTGAADVFVGASAPNLPAIEYTVMLDNGTSPPDRYLAPGERKAAVIVVQNEFPTDQPLRVGDHVVVRVVGRSGRVMADPLTPGVERQLAAGPMPIPLVVPVPPAPCDTVGQIAGAC
jgi:hypothetical protein